MHTVATVHVAHMYKCTHVKNSFLVMHITDGTNIPVRWYMNLLRITDKLIQLEGRITDNMFFLIYIWV